MLFMQVSPSGQISCNHNMNLDSKIDRETPGYHDALPEHNDSFQDLFYREKITKTSYTYIHVR